ncbi:MAG: 50S ribosomal protein L21 [Deltaproteobacteria bacterium]|nr:50S ribosomal protein L21 [Deltaproteobacteria bacterium]
MYAVIESGGKQHRVTPGEDVAMEKLAGEVGDTVSFGKVLLTSDGDNVNIGKPYLENAAVEGHITHHDRQRKIIVFKYKKRKNYRRKRGHRQYFTLVRIDNIKA